MRTSSSGLRVATLGGPTTFAGRATALFGQRRADVGDVRYLPSMDELWTALRTGLTDAICLSADSTGVGPGDSVRRLVRAPAGVQVVGELLVPYRCSLFGKPGATLAQVRRVLGHGSVNQCRPYLSRELPQAQVEVLHELNSAEAARMVAAGDGTDAVVGTSGAGDRLGLVELASDIDEGAVGLWWLLASAPRHAERPERVLLAGCLSKRGELAAVVATAAALGFELRSVYSQPTGKLLFEADHLLTFEGGPCPLEDLTAALAGSPVHLVGALPPLDQEPPAADRP
jgi:prephenate dehydratase